MTPTSNSTAAVVATVTPAAAPVPPSLSGDVVVPLLTSLLIAALVLLLTLLIARTARAWTLGALGRSRADSSTRLLVGRVVFIAIVTIGALTALGLIGVPWTTVIALTSVLGLAASLALQDVLKNFVAGIYLLVERPFRIGEWIKVRDFVGAVETIDVRTTVLRTEDGGAVMVPNAILFAEIILNRGITPPEPPKTSDEEPEKV
jgi:small conductance mechanosensitive channel